MSRRIRRARPEEAAALSRLIWLSKRSNGYDEMFMARCAEDLRVSAGDIAQHLTWVAECETLLGCVMIKIDHNDQSGEVCSFFIHPDHKRQGVGSALWQHVKQAATNRNLKTLRLDADPAAVPFYETMGFKIIGQSPSSAVPGRFLPIMVFQVQGV